MRRTDSGRDATGQQREMRGITRSVLTALVAALAVLLPGAAARAWGPDGHRIVCAIAWDDLTPHARDSVKATLDIQSRDQFADSCTFGDDYRLSHPETA